MGSSIGRRRRVACDRTMRGTTATIVPLTAAVIPRPGAQRGSRLAANLFSYPGAAAGPRPAPSAPRCAPSVPIWMGEPSCGKSATTPTFSKSTSWRTRIDLQYSQVVWTALDHKNLTGAPQFGQLATLSLMRDTAFRSAGRARTTPRTPAPDGLRNPTPDAVGNRTDSSKETGIRGTCGKPSVTR